MMVEGEPCTMLHKLEHCKLNVTLYPDLQPRFRGWSNKVERALVMCSEF